MLTKTIDPRLDQIKDARYRVAAKAVIIRDHKVLLVQETERWWSLPGGGIDHNETVTSALKRELSEEVGIPESTVAVDEHALGAIVGEIVDEIPRVGLLYKVTISNAKIIMSSDILDYGWYTAEEVAQLYISPTVGGASEILRHMNA